MPTAWRGNLGLPSGKRLFLLQVGIYAGSLFAGMTVSTQYPKPAFWRSYLMQQDFSNRTGKKTPYPDVFADAIPFSLLTNLAGKSQILLLGSNTRFRFYRNFRYRLFGRSLFL